jgi:hypothetical protein
MLRALAEALQAHLAQTRGVAPPITVDVGDGIVITSWSGGDPYAGGSARDTLRLTLPPLRLHFTCCEHLLSGQCDEWTLQLEGAAPDERAALARLFHPGQRPGDWNDHAPPVLRVDGVAGRFDGPSDGPLDGPSE